MVCKRFMDVIVVLFLTFIFNSCGSVYSDGHDYATSYAVNGIWADWQGMDLSLFSLHGNYSDIKIVAKAKPWVTVCHFYTNYNVNLDATKEWKSYSGYIEYFVSDQYPTIYSQFTSQRYKSHYIYDMNDALAYLPFAVTSETNGAVKRTATAEIRVAPHKKGKIQTYNIFFDGVSFGLDLRNLKWE